jgi:hypothetical protein
MLAVAIAGFFEKQVLDYKFVFGVQVYLEVAAATGSSSKYRLMSIVNEAA